MNQNNEHADVFVVFRLESLLLEGKVGFAKQNSYEVVTYIQLIIDNF